MRGKTQTSAAASALAAVCLTLAACGATEPSRGAPPKPKVARNPELRKLQLQANKLLDGSPAAFKTRLASLRGHPIVVNQWASWCPPCRAEFPIFQRVAASYGDRVAFLGVDSNDARDDARKFMQKFPTPYPHYYDPDAKIARVFRGGAAWPTTAFYNDRGGLVYSHPGGYRSERDLVQDVKRYALGG